MDITAAMQILDTSYPVTGCDPCDNGCECEAGSPGCGHYACWGNADTPTTCPSAKPLIDYLAAWTKRERPWQAPANQFGPCAYIHSDH